MKEVKKKQPVLLNQMVKYDKEDATNYKSNEENTHAAEKNQLLKKVNKHKFFLDRMLNSANTEKVVRELKKLHDENSVLMKHIMRIIGTKTN